MNELLQSITLGIKAVPTLPDDSQCPKCGYFDLAHPQVQIGLAYLREIKHMLAQNDGHTFIGCRCKDFEAKRERNELFRRSQANLPSRNEQFRRFSNFRVRKGADAALESAHAFAEGNGPAVLVLVGSTGCGKTHLLEAIGRRALDLGLTVRYEQTVDLLDKYRSTFAQDSLEMIDDVISWYQQMDVLLLDDLGAGKSTDFAIERLTQMIDERMRAGRRMAIATNLVSPDAMAEALGHRLASRLFQTNRELGEVKVVVMTASDYRREKGR